MSAAGKPSLSLIDLFRAFQNEAEKTGYAASARLVYYSVLNAWNEERRPECLRIRRGTLQNLTGLNESTVRNAISFLANTGWFKLGRTHSKNAPLAILLRNPCAASNKVIFDNQPLTETERVRAKAEPAKIDEVDKPISGEVASLAYKVLNSLRKIS